MKPSKKNEQVEEFLKSITGVDRRNVIRSGHCQPKPFGCGRELDLATEFQDPLSQQEYAISGLCQRCQDSVFGN